MDFGSVLSRAWQIIWKHKVLWIFGILAGCGSANTGTGNLRGNFNWETSAPPQMQNFFNQMSEAQIFALVAVAILVILVLVVLAIFLGTIGRIGVIRGAQLADQDAGRVEFSELFSGSLPYFWRVFLLNLLVGLAMSLVGIAVAVFVILGSVLTLGIGLICLLPLFCLLIPLGWVVTIVLIQANIAIVTENVGMIDGLSRGWEVFRTQFGSIIVMALILMLGVSLVGGLVIGAPLALIVGPVIAALILSGGQPTGDFFGGSLLITGLCLVAYLPVMIVLNGILQTYILTAWTLTYRRLTGHGGATAAGVPAPYPPYGSEPVTGSTDPLAGSEPAPAGDDNAPRGGAAVFPTNE